MTCIAADTKSLVMCSDSYWTDGTNCGFTKKIFRINGDLLGGAGTGKVLTAWFKEYKSGRGLSKIRGDISILKLGKDGKLSEWSETNGWSEVEESQYAIGTGGQAARAAMAAFIKATGKAECAKSVRVVSDIVADCGGPIRTYRL
jgi:hypothetical protein